MHTEQAHRLGGARPAFAHAEHSPVSAAPPGGGDSPGVKAARPRTLCFQFSVRWKQQTNEKRREGHSFPQHRASTAPGRPPRPRPAQAGQNPCRLPNPVPLHATGMGVTGLILRMRLPTGTQPSRGVPSEIALSPDPPGFRPQHLTLPSATSRPPQDLSQAPCGAGNYPPEMRLRKGLSARLPRIYSDPLVGIQRG